MAYDVIKQIPETNSTQFPWSYPSIAWDYVKTLNDKSGYANGTRLCHSPWGGGGEWGTPYNSLYGGLRPKGEPFSGFRYIEGYGIHSLVIVYEREGKSVILVRKKAQKG